MRYIIDTHALVWYFTKDVRLSNKVRRILQEAEKGKDEIFLPIIVLLETIDIQEKKKIKFALEKLFDYIDSKENFIVVDLTFDYVKKVAKRGKGLDLHDRVIFVISKIFDGVILTKDSKLKKFTATIW